MGALVDVLVVVGCALVAGVLAWAGTHRVEAVEGMAPPPLRPTVIAGAVLGALVGAVLGTSPATPAMAVFAGGAAVLSGTDLQWRRLPDRVLFPLHLLTAPTLVVCSLLADEPARLILGALSAVVLWGFYYLLYRIRPDGIGFGDVKLSPLLGLLLGWWGLEMVVLGLLVVYVSATLVLLVGLVRGWMTMKSHLPLGPFLLGGTLATVLFAGA